MYFSVTKLIVAVGLAVGPAIAFSGDMTWYHAGLGSCGQVNADSDAVVALSTSQPGHCGQMINIHYNGKTAQAKVVDSCPGCASGSIDASPSVFSKLADLDAGRVHVDWSFA
ncbi:RlpA-like double-psi beta-barrel-protein domain-containing protein-containing protein [Nemania sp. FL0031]|nr:RlpA-like double-psi beta-barrel-protein domain-containing protein-containing protein [Nemania sp. FL0031]